MGVSERKIINVTTACSDNDDDDVVVVYNPIMV